MTIHWLRSPLACFLGALLLVAAPASASVSSPAPSAEAPPRPAWTKEAVELFGLLPIQDGGRVKPLDTYAGFQLLKANGKRHVTTPWGERLDHTRWLLDVLFYPKLARTYECFAVRNDAVITALGLHLADKRKSDRYSYDELLPGRDQLFQKASELAHKEAKDKTAVERQLTELAFNVRDFERLLGALDFARVDYAVTGSPGLQEAFAGDEHPTFSGVLSRAPALLATWRDLDSLDPERRRQESEAAQELFSQLELVADRGQGLTILPPVDAAHEEWMAPSDLAGTVFGVNEHGHDHGDPSAHLAVVASLEHLVHAAGDAPAFEEGLRAVHAGIRALAENDPGYEKIPLEVAFYRGDFFYRALLFFLLGFLFVCGTWLAPGKRWLTWGVWGSLSVATGLLVTGIVLRCILRERPPVSTLYETILFISACCVLTAMVIEWINRQRIALASATVIGTLGMFLSMKYELKEAVTAGDTMPSLVAVLDTNFWLSTHVTTVTMGYAGGLLAAALAHVWLVGRMFGLKAGDRDFYKGVARMVYGVICFGLLFSVIGTILGGIWANYSWGRFWGWDPKENGALLICLAELAILHARLGGYIKDHGLCILAVLNGLVVAFSWWGVNLLGVGLHSYGFTSGVALVLVCFYVLELGVVLASGAWWLGQRGKAVTS